MSVLALLRQYPHLSGINFDLPAVIAQAEQRVGATEGGARIKHIAGDFFRSIPAEADAYLLITILHIFDDEHCLTVLNTCRRASTAQAKLLVVDMIHPDGRARAPLALHDLRMQLLSDGHERSETEFRNLFEQAGFHLRRMLPVPEYPYMILEGVPF